MELHGDFPRPERPVLDGYDGLPTAVVADVIERSDRVCTELSPLVSRQSPLVGTALTVNTPAGSNYAIHKALELAQPGDVVVVDADGFCERAVWGEIMSRYSRERGIEGVVIDGAARDSSAHHDIDFPVYCRTVTPKGPEKFRRGSVGAPITCGGATVAAGDVVVADGDGLVFVPRNEAQDVLARAEAKAEAERTWRERIETSDDALLDIIGEE